MVDKKTILGGIGEAFADRNFRVYSVGSIGSWISFFVQLVAVAWLTWELTGSTEWLAAMALLDIVPNVLLMPFTGALADRMDRHRIMIVTSFLLLLQASALAALAWLDMLTIWPLAGLVLLHGTIISFMVPAMFGTLPRFVARSALASAIAVASSYTQLAIFAGPALAGLIIASSGTTLAFFVNAMGYLILLISFLSLKTPDGFEQPGASEKSIFGDILDGFTYIGRNPTFTSLLILTLVSGAVAAGFYHMTPAYADKILGMGIVGVSIILAAQGFGAVVVALWLARGGARASARMGRVLWASLFTLLAVAALVQTANIYLAATIAALMGMAREIQRTGAMSLIQLTVDEAQRGRVMGTLFMLSQLAAGTGAYLIGAAAVKYGLPLPTTIAAAIGAAVWLSVWLRRKRLIQAVEE